MIKNVGGFLIVELMRQGRSPQDACQEAIERIAHRTKNIKEIQVGFLAMNTKGETGAYSIQKGFTYAKATNKENSIFAADYFLK